MSTEYTEVTEKRLENMKNISASSPVFPHNVIQQTFRPELICYESNIGGSHPKVIIERVVLLIVSAFRVFRGQTAFRGEISW